MQELITRLTDRAGISTEQAAKTLETIKDFVKEKLFVSIKKKLTYGLFPAL